MLTVRHVTKNDDGSETEVYAVQVPREIEAQGGEAIDAYVANELLTREENAARAAAEHAAAAMNTTAEDSDHG